MISILIPTYNYNIQKLVLEVHKQCTHLNINFEIIYLEDGSTQHVASNKAKLSTLKNTSLLHYKNNVGRTNARLVLSSKAKYNWLLFLDADVKIINTDFIKTYIHHISTNKYDAIYGGFTYAKQKPEKDFLLRWKYGQIAEDIAANIRNKTPYKIVISANFLIKKALFNALSSKIKIKSYGLDNYFGILLKENSAQVKHLDNPVLHLGLDTSKTYLNKVEEAINALLTLLNKNKIQVHQNKLLHVFLRTKYYKLNYVFYVVFILFNPLIKLNLLGHYPNITLLQIYKLAYMCYTDLNLK